MILKFNQAALYDMTYRVVGPLVTVLTIAVSSPALSVQAHPHGTIGTIIVAHGGGPAWNDGVLEVARQVRIEGPVEVAFLMGPGAKSDPFQKIVERLAARQVEEIVVVPLLVSSHSGHYEQVRYLAGETDQLDSAMLHHLHMGGLDRAAVKVPIRVARALDDATHLARILADRANTAGGAVGEQALLLIGHGPNSSEDLAAWMANLRTVADSVKAWSGFRDVRVGLVQDDAPREVRAEAVRRARDLVELQAAVTGREVVVVPILVARSALSAERIPADLAGLPIRYVDEGLTPHSALAEWIEQRVRETSRHAHTMERHQNPR